MTVFPVLAVLALLDLFVVLSVFAVSVVLYVLAVLDVLDALGVDVGGLIFPILMFIFGGTYTGDTQNRRPNGLSCFVKVIK